ncbi:Glutaredoxin [Coemansia sp. RSA 2607]|nr:Glutaredoxin [Coemansia sp. RSA 2607]
MGSALSTTDSSSNTNTNANMPAAVATKLVRTLIKENAVIVFSKDYCPYCKRAKAELTEKKIKFKAIEINLEKNGSAIQDALLSITGQRTVPNIFANGYHIGGCDDTLAALKSGKFLEKLNATKKGPFILESSEEAGSSSAIDAGVQDKAQL